MISICFVVEGHAEERFINEALAAYLQSKTTKIINIKVQNLNGGILYSKLINMLVNTSPQYDYVTTLIDLVGLDSAKLGGYSTIMANAQLDSQNKSKQVEQLITLATRGRQNIISYVQHMNLKLYVLQTLKHWGKVIHYLPEIRIKLRIFCKIMIIIQKI